SRTNFVSDYKLLFGSSSNANVGHWSDTATPSLSAWQMASGQDEHSISAAPQWVDADGANNLLGYGLQGGSYVDGSADDNFALSQTSLAVNAGTGTRTGDRFGAPIVGVIDLGAVEFQGLTSDTTPPTVIATDPVVIATGGFYLMNLDHIVVSFSEALNEIDAVSSGLYTLRSGGPDGVLGTSDDQIYTLAPSIDAITNSISLALPAGQSLSTGYYQLTIASRPSVGLHDLSGLLLDGDSNGLAGGDYVRNFHIVDNQSPELLALNSIPAIVEDITPAVNEGVLVATLLENQFADSDGPSRGIAIEATGNAVGTWQYTTDGSVWQDIAAQIANGRVLLLAADQDTRIRFVPSANYFGPSDSIVVRGWDGSDLNAEGNSVIPADLTTGSLSANTASASLEVTAVNDPPSLQMMQTDFSLDEDAGLVSFANWFANLSAGPLENGLVDFVIESVSNPGLFQQPPTFDSNGKLTFESADNASGTALVSFHISDGLLANATQLLTITIRPVNDAPTSVLLSNNRVVENLGRGTTVGNLSAIDADQGEVHHFELVSGTGSDDNTNFIIVGNQLQTAEQLDFESKPMQSIRVRVTDGSGASYEQVLTIELIDRTEIESITINDGNIQRSSVSRLQILFDGLVDIDDLNNGTFTVQRRGPGGGIVNTTAFISNSAVPGKTQVTLVFSGSFVETNGSLKDGNYDLVILAASIHRRGLTSNDAILDGDQDGVAGGNLYFGADQNNVVVAADTFFRMYGDSDGDGDVDASDLQRISLAYRKRYGEAGYGDYFEYNSTGVVSNTDLAQFNLRYRKKLPLY
ncbi:MAG: hypothetical protein KDA72_11175, partial [Planctomycetales bacterium]|nr:hypothetical protein [Planctomycetales bacterium]